MDLVFDETRPAKAVPVQIFKEATQDGSKSQVHVIIEFRNAADEKVARKRMVISDGSVSNWESQGWITAPETYKPEDHEGQQWAQYKFGQLWDAVPDAPQNILDILENALPVGALKELWNRG